MFINMRFITNRFFNLLYPYHANISQYVGIHKSVQSIESFKMNWKQRIIGEKYNTQGKTSKVI